MRTEGIASSMAYSTVEASASDAVENAARDEERERTQAAVAAALSGSPQLLIGMLMSRQRSNQSSMHASEVRSESLLSDNAQQAREEAMHAAEEAAKKAASFLGLSGVLGKIASIAALVASVSATVLTAGAGAAAIALAGSLLVACAEPLTSALVDAGIVPKKIAAEFCRQELDLDKVMFIPSGNHPLKDSIDPEHRLNMAVATFSGDENFEVNEIEIKNKVEKSFTVNTLRELKEIYESDTQFILLIGADNLLELHKWKDPHQIFDLAQVVGSRIM